MENDNYIAEQIFTHHASKTCSLYSLSIYYKHMLYYTDAATHFIFVETEYICGECSSNVAFSCIWVMEETELKWDQSFLPEVNVLYDFPLRPVPHVKMAAILPYKVIINIIIIIAASSVVSYCILMT